MHPTRIRVKFYTGECTANIPVDGYPDIKNGESPRGFPPRSLHCRLYFGALPDYLGRPNHGTAGRPLSYRTFPSTMVYTISVSRIWFSGTVMMSFDSTVKSASLPCSMDPSTSS